MKKEYIAPEMEVMEMEIESTLMTMSAPGLEDSEWGGSTGGEEADSNKRRGTWGNLWY